MLMRMYLRCASARASSESWTCCGEEGHQVRHHRGDATTPTATQGEAGVHRLIRISPFDAPAPPDVVRVRRGDAESTTSSHRPRGRAACRRLSLVGAGGQGVNTRTPRCGSPPATGSWCLPERALAAPQPDTALRILKAPVRVGRASRRKLSALAGERRGSLRQQIRPNLPSEQRIKTTARVEIATSRRSWTAHRRVHQATCSGAGKA